MVNRPVVTDAAWYPGTASEIRAVLRTRVTWKYAHEDIQRRFISLYLHGPGVKPGEAVLTAWQWYWRGAMWEGDLHGEEKGRPAC